jgi:tetratricopeptide (TPR) repeat protein/CHAT domain-containing protein
MAGLFPFGLFDYPCTMKKTKPGRKASGVLGMAMLLLLSGGLLGGWAAEGNRATEGKPTAALGDDLNEAGVGHLVKEAENLLKAGNSAAAARIWERLVVWAETNLGADHPETAAGLYVLGDIYTDLNDYTRAEPLLKRALKIREKTYGQDHSLTAQSLYDLARMYTHQQERAKAKELYLRALAIREKVLGRNHLSTGDCLFAIGTLLSDQGDYKDAEPYYARSLAITEKAMGPDHPDTASRLASLGFLYSMQNAYNKAEPLYLRALEIRERTMGADHPDLAYTLTSLGFLYDGQNYYDKAEPLYLRALTITEKAKGPNHPDTADRVANLGLHYSQQKNYNKAEALYLRSLKIRESKQEPDHPDTAESLKDLAEIYSKTGAYNKAEPLYLRAIDIIEKTSGTNHPDTAESLDALAGVYSNTGAYIKAEPIYLRALEIREKGLGLEHPDTATSLNNLAMLYYTQGAYRKAEPIHLRALETREKILGPNHADTAASLNNLALLYFTQGAYNKAEPLYNRAIKITEKVLGPDHPHTATSLNNLALLYFTQGTYSKAEPLYIRAIKIIEKALGSDHPDTAVSQDNLAKLYYIKGSYGKAEALYLRALEIKEKALGPDHPDTATSLNNLALLYFTQGTYSKAEPLYIRALKITEKVLGPDHPTTATTLNSLAGLFLYQGAYSKADLFLRRGLTAEITLIQREAPYLARIDREGFVESFGYAYEASFTWARREGESSNLALFARLNRQGLLQEIEQRQALVASLPGPQQSVAEELSALTRQLASASISPEKRQTLLQRQEELEKQLYRLLPQLRPRIVQVEQVAAALPAAGALVEFQWYRPFDGRKPRKERLGEPRYIALVLRPTGAITAVDLGSAAPIDSLIHQALTATREGLSDAEPLWGQVGQKVMDPLAPAMAGVQTLFISPDGELNRVPFAALPAPGSRTLHGQAMQLRLLTTGRELLDLAQPPGKAQSSALVVANPAFGQVPRNTPAPAQAQERSSDLQSPLFAPLPATEQEGKAISTLTRGQLLSGTQATAAAVQSAPTPQILHIASHAFFLPDLPDTTPATDGLIGKRPPLAESPMLRSGIALAGANRNTLPGMASTSAFSGEDSGDDGYLTALEVAQLNWKGTELVVISACESGTGETRAGEGVYGLRRAIAVAGARSSLLSLWKVSDEATAAFMEAYYRRLKAGEGRAAALAATQENFRSHPNPTWRHPYVWAAFQLSGDWGPIQGL